MLVLLNTVCLRAVYGPLLFILYFNPVCDLNIDGKLVTYADDTCLIFTSKYWAEVHLKVTEELNLT